MRQSIELESVPTILHVPRGNGDRIICGMADGRVVVFKIGHIANNFSQEVLLKNAENSTAITAIDTFDLTGDGKFELIVGRRDGTVQVFSLPTEDNAFDVEIRQIYNEVWNSKNLSASSTHFHNRSVLFAQTFNESISSIQGGCVGNDGCTEVIVCTYTGRIFGLSTQCAKIHISDNAQTRSPFSIDSNTRIIKFK